MNRGQVRLAELRSLMSQPMTSVWLTVDQNAEATRDDAFIHADPAAAAATRLKGGIAHALLSLSLLPWLKCAAHGQDREQGSRLRHSGELAEGPRRAGLTASARVARLKNATHRRQHG
jgi:acyl dehydratase